MSVGVAETATGSTARGAIAWHTLTAEEACGQLGVDAREGLVAAEVERRRAEVGPNKLAEAEREPGWHAFLRQYRDLMQLVLVGAAIVSMVALQEFSTGIVILGLTVLNAILGLNQEGKAAESVAALQKMLIIRAHARRGGALVDIASEEVVPGDVVQFEAGDKIPADGRLLVAATLEIEEAALTGESTPVLKEVAPVAGEDVPLGDRVDMAYMNSTVTRGRGEMVVTATGMATEVGQISGMLSRVQQEKTPLTRQLDQLTLVLTTLAGIALALVVVLGLIRGDDFDELFLIGISLAVAAIPTGLPAVVTTVLSLGTQALAAKGAIVKRLRSVETLGSTSAICSDKTGTLTLNQMTVRQLVVAGRRYTVDGEGYSRSSSSRRRAASTSRRRGASTRAWPRCRSTPSTSSWRPSTRWRAMAGRSSAATSREHRTSCSPGRRRAGTSTARPSRSTATGTASSRRTTGSRARGCACWPSPRATSMRARSTPTALSWTMCRI
jgi:Ca2+-transporting ATPase